MLRNGFDLSVRDLDKAVAAPLLDNGARWANSSKVMAEGVDIVITCLPSPAAGTKGMEADDSVLAGFASEKSVPGKIWLEMSTTDEAEVRRLGQKVRAKGGFPMDSPVSGGCHRAATGNIVIFAGGERTAFEYEFARVLEQ